MKTNNISLTELKQHIYMDSDGNLRWLTGNSGRRLDEIIGYNGKRYRSVFLNRITYKVHRLTYQFANNIENLEGQVDHIDGNTFNNHPSNLRLSTQSENMQNTKINNKNTSGYKGVNWVEHGQCWQCRITVNGKRIFLGAFKDKEKAAQAYTQAAQLYFGEFARLN